MKKRLLSLALCLALCLGLFPFGALATGGGIYVPPGGPTEGGGGTYIPGEDTRTEIWCVSKPDSIGRSYDGTTDGGRIPINLTFTDGRNEIEFKEGTDFSAVKTFDSADAGWHKVTVEITLIGEAAAKYKLKAGEEKFEIGGNINKAYPDLTVSLSKAACTVGEKILPLLSVEGAPEGAAVTYYYTPLDSGYSEFEGSDAVPAIDGNTAISVPGTYYVYAKTGGTKNYEEERSTTAELTVNEAVVEAASVTKANGTDGGTYESLPAALNAAQNGDTVTLLSDVDLGETYVTIDKSITFDLGSKTLSSSKTWSSDGVLMVKDAAVTVKNGTVKAAGDGNCAIRAYRSGAIMTLEDVTATVTSDKSSVMVGDFGSAVIKSGDYQGLYVGAKSQVTLEGGTFRPYMDNITNKNVKSIFWKVNETTDATSCDCMELLGNGCVYLDESGNQVRTGGGFNTVVTVQKGTPIDTPVAKIGDVGYTSLSKAINAVQNGGTITLLNDLDLGNGAVLQVGSPRKNFTIDLASHTLSADGDCLIMLHNGSQLTLKNGTLDGSRCTSYEGVLYISSNSGPKLTLENVTAKNVQRSVPLVYVTNGTVEFDGGSYTGGVLVHSNGNAVLKNGTFQKGNNSYSIKTEVNDKYLSDYLDDDSQFWNDNTPLDLSNKTQTADEVTVRPCKHNWENGKCTVCQKVCDHGSADGKSMTEDPCPTCRMKAAAQVDITGSDAKYFPSFNDALVYATKNNGCTLKLLANVTDPVSINTPFIFDLNGHNFNKLSVGARAKIRDSGTTKGILKELKVFNIVDADGDETVLTVADLLEEGYAFKSSSENKWYFGVENAITNVTVQPAPIKSVTAEHPTVTVEYGKTSGVTLTATAVLATEGGTVSYQWYKIGGTDFPIQDATENTYQLPADLGAGTHTYRLTATSDGYPKSVDITVKVTPISLEGATVTVKNLTYNGEKQLPMVTVTLDGKTLKNTDFDVDATMQTNAGSYTLTVNGNGNYSGKIENVEWKIEPMKIDSVKVSSDISKVYDGTAEINMSANEWATALKFKTLSAYDVVSVPSDAYTISDAYFVEKSGEETIHSPDAGEKYGITFKIALKSSNYILQNYYDEEPAETKEITQSGGAKFTIEQADAPNMSAVRLEQCVFNGLAKTYEIDLKTLLPELTKPCEYGDITYGTPSVTLNDAYYDMETGAKIENGKLLLPIKATGTVKGEIGTVTVDVTTTNYKPFKLTLNTIAQDKIPLDKSGVTVSASEITYGQTLADSKLTVTGKMKCPRTGNEIPGTFAWTNKDLKPDASDSYEAEWTFTPAAGYEEYAPTTGEVAVKVNPKSIEGAKVALGDSLTYNGSEQTQAVTSVKLDETTLTAGTDYTISGNTGKDAKGYELTISGTGNYTGEVKQAYTIARKAVTATVTVTGSYTYTGKAIEPTFTVEDEGTTIPASEYTVSYENNTNAGTAKIILKDNDVGNYIVSGGAEFTIDKAKATCTPPTANDLTYNGTAQELFKAATTQDGTTLYSMSKTSDFLPDVPLITRAGTYTFYYQVRGDSNHTDSDIGTITVTIKKAPLTITAKDKSAYVGSTAPDLSNPELNKDYTVSGLFGRDHQLTKSPVLSYATEKPDMSQIGSVDINISDADAGSNYTITYVPGKLTITTRPSSGGSGNTGTKTDTVKNPDGSTTKTETKADGSKTETTTASSSGGSTGTTVTKTDAKGNTTTEASAKLSDQDVKEAQEKGEAVSVPVKGIAAAKDANAAAKIKIDVPNNADKTTVEIPVENVTSGTVAVIVHEDGTEELVKDSKPTEGGVQLELSGSTTVKIIDNSKTFDDTKDHWSRDEVNFVAARELFNGVGGNQFGVSEPMTRGMVNTVLARLAGVDTTPSQGQAWYEVGTDWAKKNGISDGTDPTAPVTREQLATLLYRYAGSPSVSGTLHAADAASVSDYAKDALLWANQNGIVNGVGSNTIAPKDNAQRAQVAAMLARYLQNQ